MDRFELISFASDQELARSAATAWLDKIDAARRAGQSHHVAVSGGRIARNFFREVAEAAQSRAVSLGHVHFFWADERCVPPQDAESNFAVADKLLFQPLALRPDHIHRIRGEDDPDQAAFAAAAELRRVVPRAAAGQPALDLIFLGMGEDGHVASLFPGSEETNLHSAAIYEAVVAAKPPPRRITLTYGAIGAAREVWVLASGAGKEQALADSLSAGDKTPLAAVFRLRESTRVLTDLRLPPPPG